MFRVEAGSLWYLERELGPSSALFADWNELVGLDERNGVVHLETPMRIDFVFMAGPKVVAVESKKPNDLEASISARRLARQVRAMIRAADVVCLMCRGFPTVDFGENSTVWWEEIVRFQSLGVLVLAGPCDDWQVPEYLARLCPILSGTANTLQALAGTDRRRPSGGLLRGVPGVGPATESKLRARFGSALGALNQVDNWPVSAKIKERAKEMIK